MQQSEISLIVPAYQEEKRIANTIAAFSAYLDEHYPGSELIVVCDGCTDRTADVARSSFQAKKCALNVIELNPNQGKGAAVKAGMLSASGSWLFFTDADLSFEPETIELFHKALLGGADVVVAQRKKTTKYPGLARRAIAVVSRALVGNLILPGIRDTQAGFKAFNRNSAQFLFSRARITRFLFDLEILLLARRKGMRIDKVYVDWHDRPGSTFRVIVDSSRAALDLVRIIVWHLFGSYNLAQ